MLHSAVRNLLTSLMPCAVALGLSACSEAPPEGKEWTEQTRETTEHVGERVGEGAADVARKTKDYAERGGDAMTSKAEDLFDGATDAASDLGHWVSSLEQPIFEQRREKCAQEGGSWTETVHVSACREGVATLTVNGTSTKQTCEGDGPGETFTWQCVHRTTPLVGDYYFNDGPSTPHYLQRMGELISDRTHFLRWNDLFWDAGVNHDYCYHHGEITYGYAKDDCDKQFLDDLLAVCRSDRGEGHAWFDADTCMENAQGMYGAVRQFGSDSFMLMNTRVHYPRYRALFDKLGVDREPDDDVRREFIERWTF